MRRFSLPLALALTLAACSDPGPTTIEPAAPSTSTPPTTSTTHPPANSSTTSTTLPPTTTSVAPTTTLPDYPTGIDPARISIPSIGVDASVIGLDLSRPEPEVPSDFDDTGWYTATRNPGEIGPAVIAGHIDSRSGPAVFFRLDELEPGDEVVVASAAGETRTFFVVDSGQYPKSDLPPEVFGFGEPVPELRLITCGGTFDSSTGHYRDNYVVYARAANP